MANCKSVIRRAVVGEHSRDTGYTVNFVHTGIVAREDNNLRRRIKGNGNLVPGPVANRHAGYNLPAVYLDNS